MDKNGNGERESAGDRRSGGDRRCGTFQITFDNRREKIRRCVIDRRGLHKLKFD